MTRRSQGGQGLAEYLAVIGVVVALFVVLTATRVHRPGRVPVNPVTRLGVLVAPPPAPPRVVVRTARPRARRPPPRTVPPKPRVRVPRWAVGR